MFPGSSQSSLHFVNYVKSDESWNGSLIRRHFMPIDAEDTLQIPLPNVPRSNQLVWHYERRKFYAVIGGY